MSNIEQARQFLIAWKDDQKDSNATAAQWELQRRISLLFDQLDTRAGQLAKAVTEINRLREENSEIREVAHALNDALANYREMRRATRHAQS